MTTKAKRRLHEISFQKEGSHVALVSKDQGGAANGYETLIMKSAANFSPAVIKKMQQVQVTLELPEFLRKFFGMYYEDAEVLAKFLGYEAPKAGEEKTYQDYIEDKVKSFKILKSMHEAKSLSDVMTSVDENDFLAALEDQAVIEKSWAAPVEPPAPTVVEKQTQKSNTEVKMDETKIEKSVHDATLVDLEKATKALADADAELKILKAEKLAAIVKARTETVNAVLKDEKQTAAIMKAVEASDEASFTGVVEVLKAVVASVDLKKSALMTEVGASTEGSERKESGVKAILKARHSKNKE